MYLRKAFSGKKRQYRRDEMNVLAINSKNKNIRDLYRGINEFMRGYQRRNNVVKDENGDLFADSLNILKKWKKYFSYLLNAHTVSDIRHTAEPLVPDPSPCDVETNIANLNNLNDLYKSPSSDRSPAELIEAGAETLRSEIQKLINFIWNKEELPAQWNKSIIVPNYKKGDKIDCSNYCGTSVL
jgi:hypothetical protein